MSHEGEPKCTSTHKQPTTFDGRMNLTTSSQNSSTIRQVVTHLVTRANLTLTNHELCSMPSNLGDPGSMNTPNLKYPIKNQIKMMQDPSATSLPTAGATFRSTDTSEKVQSQKTQPTAIESTGRKKKQQNQPHIDTSHRISIQYFIRQHVRTLSTRIHPGHVLSKNQQQTQANDQLLPQQKQPKEKPQRHQTAPSNQPCQANQRGQHPRANLQNCEK